MALEHGNQEGQKHYALAFTEEEIRRTEAGEPGLGRPIEVVETAEGGLEFRDLGKRHGETVFYKGETYRTLGW